MNDEIENKFSRVEGVKKRLEELIESNKLKKEFLNKKRD